MFLNVVFESHVILTVWLNEQIDEKGCPFLCVHLCTGSLCLNKVSC